MTPEEEYLGSETYWTERAERALKGLDAALIEWDDAMHRVGADAKIEAERHLTTAGAYAAIYLSSITAAKD